MFGGIGLNAEVQDVEFQYQNLANYFIRASAYGGIIVGDLKGTLRNVNVYALDTNTDEEGELEQQNYYIFNLTPKIPIAVGGLCGIVRGNKEQTQNIIDCNVDIDIQFNSAIVVGKVGGLAGKALQNVVIQNSSYTGDLLTGQSALGGIVGEIEFNGTFGNVIMQDISVGATEQSCVIKLIKPAQEEISNASYVGGVIGLITNTQSLSNTQNGKFIVNANTVNAEITSDISIYGDNIGNAESDIAISYSVYVSRFIGGYVSTSGSNETFADFYAKLTQDIKENVSFTVEDLVVDMNLYLKNLRNGNSVQKLPYGYNIYLSSFIYDFTGFDDFYISVYPFIINDVTQSSSNVYNLFISNGVIQIIESNEV